MNTEKLIPITDDMTVAERRAARKHNRELMRKQFDAIREREDQILKTKYGNTDK